MIFQKITSQPIAAYLIHLPHKTAEVPFQVSIRAGACFAAPNQKDIPHLLEHYMANKLLADYEHYDAYAGLEYLEFFQLANTRSYDKKLVDLLRLIFSNSINSQTIFANEKNVLLNESYCSLCQPDDVVMRLSSQHRFVNQDAYAPSLSGDISSENLEIEVIARHHQDYVTGNNATLFVGMHEPTSSAINQLKQIIESSGIKPGKHHDFPDTGGFSDFKIVRKTFPAQRIYLSLTWPGPSRDASTEDLIAFNTIRDILVRENHSRLIRSLRVDKGLIYSVEGSTTFLHQGGSLGISTAARKEDVPTVVRLVKEEIELIKNNIIDKKHLNSMLKEDSKEATADWRSNQQRFKWVAYDLLDGEDRVAPAAEINATNRQIMSDTAYLASTAKRYLNHDRLNIIMVGQDVDEISDEALR